MFHIDTPIHSVQRLAGKAMLLAVGLLTASLPSLGQTISTASGTNFTGGNGVSGNGVVTFAVQNTSGGAINLTGMEVYWQTVNSGAIANLWVTTTLLSGPYFPFSAPDWTNIATSPAITVPANGYYPTFSGLSYLIPNGSTVRFMVESNNGVRYSGATPLPSPSTFSNGGVTLLLGDHQIAGQNVGYGGLFSNAGNNPRWFTGSITYAPAAPCSGTPAAGTITGPSSVCSGSSANLSLSGATLATGMTYQWKSSATPGGPYTNVGTGLSYSTGPLTSATYYVCESTCANSGLSATSPEHAVNVTGAFPGGTFTIDNTLPTGGTNFNNFTDAINAVNAVASCGAITGPIIVNVQAGQVFNENPPAITASGNPGNTITVQRSGAGANPVIVPTGGAGTADAGLIIHGGDHFIFDGIDINASAVTTVEYGYLVRNASATNGAQFNTVQNCTITLNRTNTTSRGILQAATTTGGGVSATAASGANSNNLYRNFNIYNAYGGVLLQGTSTAFPDANTQVTTTGCGTFNNIGDPLVANDLGNLTTTATYGILAANQSNLLVKYNRISNVSTSGAQVDGISLTTFQGVCDVSNNIVQYIRNNSTTSTSLVSGIRATHFTTGEHALRLYNNSIHGISAAYATATATRVSRGIYLLSTTGQTTYEVWHNTVSLTGSLVASSSACFESTLTSTTGILNLGNNILANYVTHPNTTPRHFGVVHTSSATVLGLSSAAVKNDIFIASDAGVTGFTAMGASTPYNGVAAWQAAVPQASMNIEDDPLLLDPATNPQAQATELNGTGFTPAPAFITNELGCAARGNDIGAREFTPPSCFPPTGSVVYVQDCANNQFFLTVTVTDLNGAPGVDVVSDQAGNPGAVFGVGLGSYQIGPFASNANVVVSLLRNGDASCDVSLGTYAFDCTTNGQNALSFDGVNDGVNCGNAASLNITGTQITLEAWIYPTAFKANTFEGNIINKEGGNAGYQIRCGGAGILESALGHGAGYITVTSPPGTLTLNTWQHVAVTYDGANARLYKNGAQVASVAGTQSIVTSPNAMRIGDYAVTPGARNFAGKIDEARVWSVVRSAADIAGFQNQQLCGNEAGLAAYYRFDQGTAGGNNAGVTTLTDLSPNGNNGTLGGFALTGPSSNWVLGVTGMGVCTTCSGTPTAGSITGGSATCSGATHALSLTGATFGLGISYQWKYGPVGGPYTNLLGTTLAQSTSGLPVGSHELVVEVTCSIGGPFTATTAPFALTVNPVPTAGAASSPGCLGQTLSLTGTTDIGTSFNWTGPNSFASGLQNPTIAGATAAAAGTYTFTATLNGCTSAPATTSVTMNPSPSMGAVSATPATICSGDNSQLSASATAPGYFQTSGGATWTDIAGSGVSVGAISDDSEHNITIPAFTFNGTSYTAARVGTNGVLVFGATTGDVALTNATLPSSANSAGSVFLAPWWDDLDIQGGASILTQTVGNRHIVQWNNMAHNNATGGVNNVYFQIQLDLVTGAIYYVYQDVLWGNATYDAGASATVGIQWANAAGSAIQFSFNTASLSAGQVITYLQNAPNFSWSPATFLDNPAIANPLASGVTATTTYTVTATAANGCAVQGTATVNVVPIDDGDPCTVDGCSGGVATHVYTDTDNDGTCDGLDGCPTDANKIAPGTCGCGVSDVDTDGDLTADCNDGCPLDPNKTAPGICGCGVSDVDGDGDLTADCNDGCPTDPNKTAPGLCGCFVPEGSCDDCEGTPSGPAQPGTSCDDNDACTINDVWSPACVCGGTFQDSDGDSVCDANDVCPGFDDLLDSDGDATVDCLDNCPFLPGQIGSSCDDGDPNTINDTVDALCVCAGVVPPCPDNLTVLTLTTDDDSEQTSWDVIPVGGGAPVCSGVGLADNFTFAYNCCLPNGCYELRVFDSAGDGIANGSIGGYVLTQSAGNKRIIDNSGDAIFTSLSQVAGGLGFCVPLGNDAVLPLHCDKNDWLPTDVLQATVNSAVTGQFGITNSTSGYQFWFFNPDGGYSRRILQTHAAPGAVSGAPASVRASYLKLSSLVTQPLPMYSNLNVRVRTQVAGVFSEFGPACRFRLDPPCTTTQLTLTADPVVSCGATGLSLTSVIYAATVPGATHYQFEFSKPGYLRRIAHPVRSTALSFVTNPLQNNNCYQVRVRVSLDNAQTYCPFGPYCSVTIGTALCAPAPAMILAPEDGPGVAEDSPLTVWPNPNDGTEVNLSIAELELELSTVLVEVTDVYGKLVASRTLPVQDGYLNQAIAFEQDLAPGLYLVNLQAGERRHTERLVIQR